MRFAAAGFLISALFAMFAPGQTSTPVSTDRLFRFHHAADRQQMGEIATAIRTIADIREIHSDFSQKTLTVHATAEQIGLAEWLFLQLDQPVIPAPNNQNAAAREYLLQTPPENQIRIFYLPGTRTVQEFQEAATAIRTVADIRRVFTYNEPRALITRGSADQIDLAAWLVKQLNESTEGDYRMPSNADPRRDIDAHVFHVTHADSIRSFQAIATLLRTIVDIRRVFTYNPSRTLLVRATPEQVALSAWLLTQVDLPAVSQPSATPPAPVTYRFDNDWDSNNNMVGVFYLPQAPDVQTLQRIATQLRSATNIRRVFTYDQPRVLAMRGTTGQLSQAEQILKPPADVR